MWRRFENVIIECELLDMQKVGILENLQYSDIYYAVVRITLNIYYDSLS